jgi:excisionase family DNA binding protein
VQTPCGQGAEPARPDGRGHGRNRHHSTEEVNTRTRTPQPSRKPASERDDWLTIEEVCTELKISRRTFDRWRALGTGPKVKHLAGNGSVRIRRSWLNEWLDVPDQDIA